MATVGGQSPLVESPGGLLRIWNGEVSQIAFETKTAQQSLPDKAWTMNLKKVFTRLDKPSYG